MERNSALYDVPRVVVNAAERDPRPLVQQSLLERGFLRGLDIVISLVAIIMFLPVLLLTAIAVKVTSKGPVLFAQRRIGRHGQVFRCFKFRTMMVDAEERLANILANDPLARSEWHRDHKLKKDPRITSIGRYLRSSSLDELPQLLNVLLGTMSLVGPRPIVDAEVVRYGRYYVTYCKVRPGMTGLWQISGRNNTTYRRRVAMDVSYVQNRSAALNFRILVMTIPMVIVARGSY